MLFISLEPKKEPRTNFGSFRTTTFDLKFVQCTLSSFAWYQYLENHGTKEPWFKMLSIFEYNSIMGKKKMRQALHDLFRSPMALISSKSKNR